VSIVEKSKDDIFLKLDGIPGESKDATHKDEINDVSFSLGTNRTARGNVEAGDSSSLEYITVTRILDKATPKLYEASATGRLIDTLVLTCRKAGKDQQEYFVVTCTGVQVLGVAHSHVSDDDRQSEQMMFGFRKIEMGYREQRADGGPRRRDKVRVGRRAEQTELRTHKQETYVPVQPS
jgi:type VI secretion system secreted protein Hcp